MRRLGLTALKLEQIAAATYLSAIPVIGDKGAIELAGSIQIIDMQHAAILLYVLGERIGAPVMLALIGLPEALILAAVILLLFGANKLPGVARSAAQARREFDDASAERRQDAAAERR